MHMTLEVKRYHEFFWLREIHAVNIYECCAQCFIGKRFNNVYHETLRKMHAFIDMEILPDPLAKAYYLCGLSAGYDYSQNTHVAFIPAKGEKLQIVDQNIRLRITDAREIRFQNYVPHPQHGYFTDRQRRCRNWIFANYINDGMLKGDRHDG